MDCLCIYARSFQAASWLWPQAAAGQLESAFKKHSHPQTAQTPSPAAPCLLSPASCPPPASSTAGALLGAVAGAFPTAAGHGWLEGCEGGHSSAKGPGSMGREGQAMPAAATCFCSMEGCGSCTVQSGLQIAGTCPLLHCHCMHVPTYFNSKRQRQVSPGQLTHHCCAASSSL